MIVTITTTTTTITIVIIILLIIKIEHILKYLYTSIKAKIKDIVEYYKK